MRNLLYILLALHCAPLVAAEEFEGKSSDGGGSIVNEGKHAGMLYDTYLRKTRMKPTSHPAFVEHVEPVLKKLKNELPGFEKELREVLGKRWQAVDAKIPNLPKDATQIIFNNQTVGYQTDKYIFLNESWLSKASAEEISTLFLHELVQGARLKNNKLNRLRIAENKEALLKELKSAEALQKKFIVSPDAVEDITLRLLDQEYKNGKDLREFLQEQGFGNASLKNSLVTCTSSAKFISLCLPKEQRMLDATERAMEVVEKLEFNKRLRKICDFAGSTEDLETDTFLYKKFIAEVTDLHQQPSYKDYLEIARNYFTTQDLAITPPPGSRNEFIQNNLFFAAQSDPAGDVMVKVEREILRPNDPARPFSWRGNSRVVLACNHGLQAKVPPSANDNRSSDLVKQRKANARENGYDGYEEPKEDEESGEAK